MDETDKRILAALRRNGRASISDLAGELGVTRGTVRSHIEAMERAGIILGYTVVTAADLSVQPVRGVVLIGLEGRSLERVVAALRRLPEVHSINTTNGTWDIVVEFGTDDLRALDDLLAAIREIDGVIRSDTSLYLRTRLSHAAGAANPPDR